MTLRFGALLLVVLPLLAAPANGQTLTMTNGSVIVGRYLGGTQDSIIFEVDGETKIFSIYDIQSMEFAQVEAAEDVANTSTVTLPAGTLVLVKLDQELLTGSTREGERFTATLETDIVAEGYVIASKGTKFHGRVVEAKKAGRIRGRASLQITLTDVVIDNQLFPVSVDTFGLEGSRSGTLAKIAAGAAIGAIADGSSGVDEGAAVGAAAAVLTPGNQIRLAGGSLVEFRTLNQRTITISE